MDENEAETNLQAFIRLLYEAHDASTTVDYFDLRSDNDASVQKWNQLVEQQRTAFHALHELCHRIPVDDLIGEE